ncbi:MAG: hypothetical protein NT042_08390 [Sulfuritalea sp.]|nr:hypothetical protein [Sulfuritalea sp.]
MLNLPISQLLDLIAEAIVADFLAERAATHSKSAGKTRANSRSLLPGGVTRSSNHEPGKVQAAAGGTPRGPRISKQNERQGKFYGGDATNHERKTVHDAR